MRLQVVPASAIPGGWMGLDIGPDSIKTFSKALDTTQTVIWNGPMGVFEFEKFAAGTEVPKKLSFEFQVQSFGLNVDNFHVIKYVVFFLFAGRCQEAG